MIVSVSAHNVKNACAAARRALGLKLRDSREVLRSGGEDGLFRVHLADGTIVEAAIKSHSPSTVWDIAPDRV